MALLMGALFENFLITYLLIIFAILLCVCIIVYSAVIKPLRLLKAIETSEFLGDFPVYKSEPVSTGFGIGYSDEPIVVHNFEYQDVIKGYVGHFKCTMKNGKIKYYKVKYNSWLYKKLKLK